MDAVRKIKLFDSTLRDGAQAEGISFTVEDKLRIVKKLDELGLDYVEAGNPGSNKKDMEFFKRMSEVPLSRVRLTAFGSTRRVGLSLHDDSNVLALLKAETPAVAIFGKAWDFHVKEVLKTTNGDNLEMIADTLSFFKAKGKEVFFDAEHFYDGYKSNPDYALEVCRQAAAAGADCVVLCDTNGGSLPLEIYEITRKVRSLLDPKVELGIHCHNDAGMAVANSLMAVQAGAVHVQGTFNGFGERCGNANLATILANLQLKQGFSCIPDDHLVQLTETSRFIDEVANLVHDERAPYVGKSAFVHKGGMHIDGVNKNSATFEHVNPESVGNERRFLISEQAGRGLILKKIQTIDASLQKNDPRTIQIVDALKRLENEGYQFEGAEASFQLRTLKVLDQYHPFFHLVHYQVIANRKEPHAEGVSMAVIKIQVDGKESITVAEGDGPINALDRALRKILMEFYPEVAAMRLADYKVRVLGDSTATAERVRVLIQSTDSTSQWTTVGVSSDIIEASWIALVDSFEYFLFQRRKAAFSR